MSTWALPRAKPGYIYECCREATYFKHVLRICPEGGVVCGGSRVKTLNKTHRIRATIFWKGPFKNEKIIFKGAALSQNLLLGPHSLDLDVPLTLGGSAGS